MDRDATSVGLAHATFHGDRWGKNHPSEAGTFPLRRISILCAYIHVHPPTTALCRTAWRVKIMLSREIHCAAYLLGLEALSVSKAVSNILWKRFRNDLGATWGHFGILLDNPNTIERIPTCISAESNFELDQRCF